MKCHHLSGKLLSYLCITFLALIPLLTTADDSSIQQGIDVSATIAPELKGQINPEHTVFIYARAAQGPRMPLAIVSRKASELPLTTHLNASMAMMPQMSLDKFSQVVLMARISASGDAMPQSGDFMGEYGPVNWKEVIKE